jgi:hypothetical protein
MARNFAKEKEMRHTFYLLFVLIFLLRVFHDPYSADADDGIKLDLLFSANINGELEPCG